MIEAATRHQHRQRRAVGEGPRRPDRLPSRPNQAVTAEEHDQLHAMLEALHLPTERLHRLDMRG